MIAFAVLEEAVSGDVPLVQSSIVSTCPELSWFDCRERQGACRLYASSPEA